MSAEAYANRLRQREPSPAVSRPRRSAAVAGGALSWADACVAAQLEGLSAILWGWSRLTLAPWAFWLSASADPVAEPIRGARARRR
jgi:hypothetical protein